MRVEDIAITLRPRSAWEAIDLGYAMAQNWWKPLFSAWCAVYFPAALLINLACWQHPGIAVFVLWWLKPAFDRVVLHVLAAATFGAIPSLRDTLHALPRLWWNNRLAVSLTYGRFDFARSFHLPMIQLEGARGQGLRKRRRVLGREGRGEAVWLTIICLHLEITLIASCYLMINLFSPGDPAFQLSWQMLFNAEVSKGMQFFGNAVNVIAISVLEPFYVAAGFAIYLNCRTVIEGWDVELAFKKMSSRIHEATRSTTTMAGQWMVCIALVCAAGFMLSNMPEAWAQNETTTPPQFPESTQSPESPTVCPRLSPDEVTAQAGGALEQLKDADIKTFTPDTGAADAAFRVLDSKEFGQYKDSWKIRYIGPGSEQKPPPKKYNWAWLKSVIDFFAQSVRVLAWIGVVIVASGLLYLIARYVGLSGWGRQNRKFGPDMLFGLDIRPESLPDNVPHAARKLLNDGRPRESVSLLYRAALVALIQDGRIEIGRGDTEGECVQRVRRAYAIQHESANLLEGKPDYFSALVKQWQRIAYAREMVGASDIEPLIEQWAIYFIINRADSSLRKSFVPPPGIVAASIRDGR